MLSEKNIQQSDSIQLKSSKQIKIKFTQLTNQVMLKNNSNIIGKVTKLLSKPEDDVHDRQIFFQRLLYILKLEPQSRTEAQLKFLITYFESEFEFIQNLKGKFTDQLYTKIFKNMLYESVPEYAEVFSYGDIGRKMFFILSGSVDVLIPTKKAKIRQMNRQVRNYQDLLQTKYKGFKVVAAKHQYEHFGEIAIEQRIPRTATILCREDCIFASLSFETYQEILIAYKQYILDLKLDIIQQFPLFKRWDHHEQQLFCHECEIVDVGTNVILYKKGVLDESLYLISQGEIEVQLWKHDPSGMTINRSMTVTTIGVYSTNQIIGDYEFYADKIKNHQALRITQARTLLQSKLLKVSIRWFMQIVEKNRQYRSFMNSLQEKFQKKWLVKPDLEFSNQENIIQKKQYISVSRQSKALFRIIKYKESNFDQVKEDQDIDLKKYEQCSWRSLQLATTPVKKSQASIQIQHKYAMGSTIRSKLDQNKQKYDSSSQNIHLSKQLERCSSEHSLKQMLTETHSQIYGHWLSSRWHHQQL